MDENRARRVTDALRDRGIAAHLRKSGIDAYSVQVPAGQGREAVWGAEGTTGLEAEVLLDGDLVGFVPQVPGSENFDEAQIVEAIARAETGYHPSRALQHLIRARSATCTAPGCRRPAARCDLDHTVPWDQGGRTCECGLAPLCRHHHRCKQAQGWRLAQPEPGVLVWHTPAGRTYATAPTVYTT